MMTQTPTVDSTEYSDEELAEPMGGEHVLSIGIELALEGTKTHNSRIRDAYRRIIEASVKAAAAAFLSGTKISRVTSTMRYDYRQLEGPTITWKLSEREGIGMVDGSDEPDDGGAALI